MRSKLTPVVGGDGPDVLPVREEHPDHGFRRRDGLFPFLQPLHKDEVRRTLRQREYCMAICVHNRVHLPVAETPAVGFGGPLVDAGAVGNVCRLGRAVSPRSFVVFQLMGHVPGQFSRRVGMDVVVDGLLADAYAFLTQNASYLPRRPVVLYHAVDAPPQFVWLAVVACEAVPASLTPCLRIFPYVAAVRLRVAPDFAAHCRFGHSYFVSYTAFAPFPFQAKINCVSLCLG